MRDNFVIYVDFDATLYNTALFAKDLLGAIAQNAGLPLEKVEADAAQHHSGQMLMYDYTKQVTTYGLDANEMWAYLDNLVQNTHYLYDDSADFIQSLQADGYNPKILSFGEKRFQLAKIRPMVEFLSSKDVSQDLEVIVVDRRKREHIAELHSGQSGVLVDDVPEQQLPQGFTEIHLDRSSNLLKPLAHADDFVVSNLRQARLVIDSLN